MPTDLRELSRKVESLKLAPQVTLSAKVEPGSRAQEVINVTTNVWGIFSSKSVPIYRYDVRVLEEYPPRKGDNDPVFKEVTKQTKDDFVSIDRKNKCVAVYLRLLAKEKNFFGDLSSFVYDRASILYSLSKLNINQDEVKTFHIQRSELPERLFSEDCLKLCISVKQCTEDFQLTSKEYASGVSTNPDEINRSLQQFYELLVSQEAFFTEGRFVCYGSGESYLLNPSQFGFGDHDTPSLPDGKYVGIGVSKAVKIIEGPRRGIAMSVHLDVKKAAFHIENQCLVEKVMMLCNSRDLNGQIDDRDVKLLNGALRGLYVRCNYGRGRTFSIAGIAGQSAERMKLNKSNSMVSLKSYFEEKYNIFLKHANLPLVMDKSSRGINYYPMELLFVCENQRVTLTQQSSLQVQQMIKACATPPFSRSRQMMNMVAAMKLNDCGHENRWFNEMEMKLSGNSLQMEARVLPRPEIIYASGSVARMKDSAQWSFDPRMHYLIPASCDIWGVVALISASDKFSERNLNSSSSPNFKFSEYLDFFIKRCRMRGMNIANPKFSVVVPRARESDIAVNFQNAQKIGATYIHFITSENLKFHDKVKFLENQTQILTQDVMSRTAAAAPHKTQTLDNIVHKANLKLGGLNFELRLETKELQNIVSRGDRMIIGIDLAFALVPKGSRRARVPSVVGKALFQHQLQYASNCRSHPLDFIGGYRYAWSEMEELDEGETAICDLVAESLLLSKKNRHPPSHIIILRDGISEGQYKYVVEREVEQIKEGCRRAGGERYRPHITVLVATKKHNLRIYRQQMNPKMRVPEQNLPPGTVIDTEVVNPVLTEFYLNSHTALQGTAKTPRYNLLFDTSKMQADEMEALVYALTFNFQIVSQACSLPAPIMIADRMASRGRNNFNVR